MVHEEWRDICGYEGCYQVSSLGGVRSLDRTITYINGRTILTKGKVLNCYRKDNGYIGVDLYDVNKVRRKHHVHRLVAQAFIENPHDKPMIDHINTIRDDNRVENLRWVTQSENLSNLKSKINMIESHKGCVVSDATKDKFSKMYTGGGNPASKKVVCDGILYECIKDFAETTDYAYTTVLAWLNPNSKSKPPKKYIEKGLTYL